mgnify:FL=1
MRKFRVLFREKRKIGEKLLKERKLLEEKETVKRRRRKLTEEERRKISERVNEYNRKRKEENLTVKSI